ncbi:thiamine pyrophosphate-binding protein [Lachnospiraceae bacterium 62-35]
MRMKVSNYIAQKLVDEGITQVFTVTGGGAMHLNDALGHQEGLTCLYNHHEQASAIAAESYARIHNRIAALCVTTGPGGTNAITGVVGGWLDSIPMFVVSGQVRYDTTARWSGVGIRAMGDQEFDIVKAIECMTKYSEMVIDARRIRFCIEKALYLSYRGRRGPTWLDIPLDIQGAYIDTDELIGFDKEDYEAGGTGWAAESEAEIPEDSAGHGELREKLPPRVAKETARAIIGKIKESSRPVLNAGNGVRLGGAHEVFLRVVEKLGIPVVTGWNSEDCLWDTHPLYVGRPGNFGDRPGNFAVQNSDLVFSVGSRLSLRQVGYNYKTWARAAYVIYNDIDWEELHKPSVHADMRVHADAKELLEVMEEILEEEEKLPVFKGGEGLPGMTWQETCQMWKEKYPVVLPRHYEGGEENAANVYAFIKELSRRLPEGKVTVVGNGSACVVGGHAYVLKKDQRFITNSAIASMGYDLPAAIGACVADGKRDMVLVTGDGSMQMNIQELQTIIHHRLPIKIFVINNGGYHSIRQTQKNFFGEPLVGIGEDSHDLSFPDLSKLSAAYGYPYVCIRNNKELEAKLEEALAVSGPIICEVFVTWNQVFEPKSSAKRLPDGTIVSPPLEDLSPFLPDEEMDAVMIIPRIKD